MLTSKRNELITELRERVKGKAYVSSTAEQRIARFPHISFVRKNNYLVSRYVLSGKIDNVTREMYEVNIYVGDAYGPQTKAEELADIVDDLMLEHGYIRTFMNTFPTTISGAVYRLLIRYMGSIYNGEVYVR